MTARNGEKLSVSTQKLSAAESFPTGTFKGNWIRRTYFPQFQPDGGQLTKIYMGRHAPRVVQETPEEIFQKATTLTKQAPSL